MIDQNITWKNHMSFVCSRISQNIGIISNLTRYISIQQLKQIYYYSLASHGKLTKM